MTIREPDSGAKTDHLSRRIGEVLKAQDVRIASLRCMRNSA